MLPPLSSIFRVAQMSRRFFPLDKSGGGHARGNPGRPLEKHGPGLMADALLGVINSYAAKWLVAAEGTPLMVKVRPVVDIFLGGVRKNAL